MSYLNIKQALVSKLLSATLTGISVDDMAFENHEFKSDNKDIFLSVDFIPVATEITGKTVASTDEVRGVFQIGVFVKLNAGNYDNTQLIAVDEIISEFRYNDQATFDGQVVYVLESTVTDGTTDDTWFKRAVSINFLTFNDR